MRLGHEVWLNIRTKIIIQRNVPTVMKKNNFSRKFWKEFKGECETKFLITSFRMFFGIVTAVIF